MQVYIELVILDNFVFTYLICLTTYRLLKIKIKKKRVFIICTVATAVAVLLPFAKINAVLLFCLKIVFGASLGAALTIKSHNDKILSSVVIFFLSTFAYGGIVFFVNFMLYQDVVKALTMPVTKVPFAVIILLGLLLYAIVKKISVTISRRFSSSSFEIDVALTVLNKTTKLKAFIDSGNKLFDLPSGLPIAVLSSNSIKKALDINVQLKVMLGDWRSINGARYITVNTASGASKMLVLTNAKVQLYLKDDKHTYKEVTLGLSSTNFNGFDLLLPSDVENTNSETQNIS